MPKFKATYLLALVIIAALAYWMSQGPIIIGGQANAENAAPSIAERNEVATQVSFKVRVQKFSHSDQSALLEIRGRTEADAKVAVSAETPGRVLERSVDEGSRVKKGDLLCRLDMGSRKASLLKAEAQVKQAEFDYEAGRKLNKRGFTAEARVAALKFALDSAKAGLEDITLDIARTEVRAPVDGIVQTPVAEVGGMLSGGGVCATLINVDPMLMIGQVSERDIASLSVGMPAKVKLVEGGMRDGEIRYIASSADASTRTFRIEIAMDNSDHKIRDGLTARAVVILPPKQAHLVSPAILTLADDGRIGVRAIEDDKRVVFMPVKILGDTAEGVWVSGLPKDVTVIVVGQDFVIDGQIVDPVLVAASRS